MNNELRDLADGAETGLKISTYPEANQRAHYGIKQTGLKFLPKNIVNGLFQVFICFIFSLFFRVVYKEKRTVFFEHFHPGETAK